MTATTSAPPVVRARLHRRTLRVLVASLVLSGLGLAAGITVGALLAQDMLGTSSLSGLPSQKARSRAAPDDSQAASRRAPPPWSSANWSWSPS